MTTNYLKAGVGTGNVVMSAIPQTMDGVQHSVSVIWFDLRRPHEIFTIM